MTASWLALLVVATWLYAAGVVVAVRIADGLVFSRGGVHSLMYPRLTPRQNAFVFVFAWLSWAAVAVFLLLLLVGYLADLYEEAP